MQHGATLQHPIRHLLRDLVKTYGSVSRVSRETGLSRYQVTVLVSDAPVQAGTIALAEQRCSIKAG